MSALADRLAELTRAPVTQAYDVVTADVPAEQWVAAASAARDGLELDFFDLLTVVDQYPDGFDVVLRLWSVAQRHAVHLRARLPRAEPAIDSLVELYGGAAWHERHAAEMFGVVFRGHPDLSPLLLAPGGARTPLRKDQPLSRRAERPWPGAQDPAHSGDGGRPSRRQLQPLGLPEVPAS